MRERKSERRRTRQMKSERDRKREREKDGINKAAQKIC